MRGDVVDGVGLAAQQRSCALIALQCLQGGERAAREHSRYAAHAVVARGDHAQRVRIGQREQAAKPRDIDGVLIDQHHQQPFECRIGSRVRRDRAHRCRQAVAGIGHIDALQTRCRTQCAPERIAILAQGQQYAGRHRAGGIDRTLQQRVTAPLHQLLRLAEPP
jgi:hypothetical protein